MPRLTRLSVAALEDLAAQLRYAPGRRVRDLLSRAESLAGEIDPDRAYPEDWLVQRITGFRPAIDEAPLLVGAAVLRDLSAFVERVSDHAALRPADAQGALRVADLCARWSVSRKTIDRFRRRGLVARRVRDERGHTRLAFMPGAVEAFERREGERLCAAAAFERMSPAEARSLVRLGARARRRFGWSLNDVAQRLAVRTGHGRETLRQLLRKRLPDEEGRPLDERAPLTPHQRRFVERAERWGVAPSAVARRLGRTPALVHLVLLQRRAARLRRLNLPPQPAWTAPMIANALRDERVRAGLRVDADTTIEGFVARARAAPAPNRALEHALARAHRALLARAASTIAGIDPLGPRAADIDRAETDLRWAAMLRARLVELGLALALKSVEARLGRPLESERPARARELHEGAMNALIAAAAAFDPGRGGRFAAPANLALNRALAHAIPGPSPERRPGRAEHGAPPGPPAPLVDWPARVAPWQTFLDPDPRLVRSLGLLSERERQAATLRYALAGGAPLTSAEACAALGAPPGSLARLTRAARVRLRTLHAPKGATAAPGAPARPTR